MQLLRLPYIVKKAILDHLSFNQMLFLSLCSKNTKNFIIRTQRCQFERIQQVTYLIYDETIAITVIIDDETCPSLVMYVIRSETDFPKFKLSNQNYLIEEVRVNEFGVPFLFLRCSSHQTELHAKYRPDNMESTLDAIHDRLYDLLGKYTSFELKNVSDDTPAIPMLRNIQKLGLIGDCFDSKQVDEFTFRSSCLEYLEWIGSRDQKIEFTENSKVYEIDTVYISYQTLAKNALKYFKGRHIFLADSIINTTDVIQFLNAWKSGEKFRNLEVISIKGYFDIATIKYSFQFKEVNTEVVYSFVRKFRKRELSFPSNYPWEFISDLYMVRESDGHVASVILQDHLFVMGVWNMKEEEFLEKFQLHI